MIPMTNTLTEYMQSDLIHCVSRGRIPSYILRSIYQLQSVALEPYMYVYALAYLPCSGVGVDDSLALGPDCMYVLTYLT